MSELKTYLGVKFISAKPMNSDEALKHGYKISDKIDHNGYEVTYHGGYKSWSPREEFEQAYYPTDGLTFGLAIDALKMGLKVCRNGWNGKGMWLRYINPYFNTQFTITEKQDIEGTLLPFIGMKTADNSFVPWLASQTDMLATDWMIIT